MINCLKKNKALAESLRVSFSILNVKIIFLLALLLLPTLILGAQTPSFFVLGKTSFLNDDFAKSAAYFEKSLLVSESVPPKIVRSWLIKSQILTGHYKLALKNITEYFNTVPPGQRATEIYYLEARIYYLTGNYERAVKLFIRFLYDFPNFEYTTNSYYWLASSLYNLGRHTEAQQIYYLILAAFPNHYLEEYSIDKLFRLELLMVRDEAHKLFAKNNISYPETEQDYEGLLPQ